MGFSVPYAGVRLANPVIINYIDHHFRVVCTDITGVHWTSDFIPFSVSLVLDIDRIVEQVNQYVSNNPASIIFTNEECDMSITDWKLMVSTHMLNWMKEFSINAHDIDLYLKRPIAEQKIKIVQSDRVFYTDTYNNTGIYDTYSRISTTGTSNNFSVQPTFPQIRFRIPREETFSVNIMQCHYTNEFWDLSNIMQPEHISLNLCLNDLRGNNAIPLLAIMSSYPRNRYFMKDYLNMTAESKKYLEHFIENIISTSRRVQTNITQAPYIQDLASVHGVNIEQLLKDEVPHQLSKQYNMDAASLNYIIHNTLVIWDYVSRIKEHKILYKYPMSGICSIPAISAYPQTAFQWVLTNEMAKRSFDLATSLVERNFTKIFVDSERENTKVLLPYIHASDKVLEMYLRYIDALDENGKYKISHAIGYVSTSDQTLRMRDDVVIPFGMTEDRLKTICTDMLRFIADGKNIHTTYPNPIEIEEYGTIKMSPVEGTLLKQLRNSIFNHRMETKISLEIKLKSLIGNATDEENAMKCPITLPEELETYRIKRKSDMIGIGKILGHCIGNYTNSSDIFFRKDTVCAQVKIDSMLINQCYDAHNKVTETSQQFNEWLTNALVIFMASSLAKESLMKILEIPEEDHDAFVLNDYRERILQNHGQIRSMYIATNKSGVVDLNQHGVVVAGNHNFIVANPGNAIIAGHGIIRGGDNLAVNVNDDVLAEQVAHAFYDDDGNVGINIV